MPRASSLRFDGWRRNRLNEPFTNQDDLDEPVEYHWPGNPLLEGILDALGKIEQLKCLARDYYYGVVLSGHVCPSCGGCLRMTGPSRCQCDCGVSLDPTVAFQRCQDCGGALALQKCHYACRHCHRVQQSRFLFDERVFSAEYFRERMAESRQREKDRLDEMRRWLASTRSEPLRLDCGLSLDSVPDLDLALNEFIGQSNPVLLEEFRIMESFRMEKYWRVILAGLDECRLFSSLPQVCEDSRRDRARRFTTLVFMQHEQVVDLVQQGNDLWVMRHEVDA